MLVVGYAIAQKLKLSWNHNYFICLRCVEIVKTLVALHADAAYGPKSSLSSGSQKPSMRVQKQQKTSQAETFASYPNL